MEYKTKNKKDFLFVFLLLFFIFMISSVSSAQPVQINTGDTGIEVEYSNYDIAKLNTPFQLNTHAFNKSDGNILTVASTDCSFHLYNSTGHEIYDEMFLETGLHEFYKDINSSIFSDLGIHSYLIHCNSTGIGGFASGNYNVTPTGFNDLENFYFIILLAATILIIAGFLMSDPWIVILGSFVLTFNGLYILINGIVGIRDLTTTWAIGIILLAVAAYCAIKAAMEMVNG